MNRLPQFRERARVLFPSSPSLQRKWVRAQLRLKGARPRIEIGLHAVDTSRAARTLREAGICALQDTIVVPRFVQRFVGRA